MIVRLSFVGIILSLFFGPFHSLSIPTNDSVVTEPKDANFSGGAALDAGVTGHYNDAGKCEAVPPCACRGPSGVIQLSPLAQLLATNSKGYLSTTGKLENAQVAFYFNPCAPLRVPEDKDDVCKSSSACLEMSSLTPKYFIGTGEQNSLTFTLLNPLDVQLEYAGVSTPIFDSHVQCRCNKDRIQDPLLTFYMADIKTLKTILRFYLDHTCCCPDSCKDGLPSGGGGGDEGGGQMSYGTLIAILFGVSVAAYLITGVAFNKYKRGESGKNLIPNRQFWVELPALIMDGGRCVIFCLKGSRGYAYIP